MEFVEDDSRMITYNARLGTFKSWPFDEDCSCTPDKMAEAGFYLVATAAEPDLVRCYYCHKELDGWEPQDIPWDEHKRGDCPYIKKGKKPMDLTGDDVFELEAERYCAILRKISKVAKEKLLASAEEVKEKITKLGTEKQKNQGRKKRKKN